VSEIEAQADHAQRIQVEVVYSLPAKCWRTRLELPAGSCVGDAISASGFEQRIPDLVIDPAAVGVFGQLRALDAPLRDGDRVEIYRPLQADPKQARRERARGKR
jgi:putative ubiquitin-RnfH superfamily antitoxin RatB of RatAB toxin-antitoxin module